MSSPLLPHLPGAVSELVEPIRPELAPGLLAAIESITRRVPATAVALRAVEDAVASHRVPVYETASYILGDLAVVDHTALAALVRLSHSPDARVRFNALLCLTEETPEDVVQDLLVRGLSDKSSRVRCKAADWAGRLKRHTMLPHLRAAFATEGNSEAKATMAAEIRRLEGVAALSANSA